MRAWVAEKFGTPSEVLRIDDVDRPSPGSDDVLVEVEAATVNNNDIDAIRGRWATLPVPAPFVPGLEVTGVVTDAGASAREWIGKRVVGMPRRCFGGYAQFAVLPTTMTFEIPTDMPLEQAAGMFWPFHLAWLGVTTRARLQKCETLLVHSAAGGAGSAAVQLGVQAGARVIATVGSNEKLAICSELGASAAINYRESNLIEQVLEANNGRGVDVCFDGTGGDLTEKTWRCLGFGARHVMFGFSSGVEQTDGRAFLLRDMIFGNFSLMGALLTYVERDDIAGSTGMVLKDSAFNFPSRTAGIKVHEALVDMLQSGKIRTVIDRVIDFDDLPTALAAFERREIIGRVIVRV